MSDDALIRRQNLRTLGLGPTELVKQVGSSYSYWRDLLEGNKSFGEKAARRIEDALGLPRGVLDSASQNELRIPQAAVIPSHASDELVIPQYDTGGKMGNGLLLRDQPGVIKSWTVSDEWMQKNVHRVSSPSNLAIVTGFGDSMQPLYNPGDPLLVDLGVKTVESDGVYFFRVGDEGFIKRLQRIPSKGLLVISDNPKYRDWSIERDSVDFAVFGKVVKAWRGEDF